MYDSVSLFFMQHIEPSNSLNTFKRYPFDSQLFNDFLKLKFQGLYMGETIEKKSKEKMWYTS